MTRSVRSAVKAVLPPPLLHAARRARASLDPTALADRLRLRLGWRAPADALEREAHAFWNDRDDDWLHQMAHWRGAGMFEDEERWLRMGRFHLELFRRLVAAAERAAVGGAAVEGAASGPVAPTAFDRIVEWGCGGGANAVAFGALARSYVGIDVAPATLAECARQMRSVEGTRFEPVLVDTQRPEDALSRVAPGSCDLFLCIYVMEVLPSPEYGMRVLRIAHELLRPGGFAFVHFKYDRGDWRTAAKRWDYVRHFPANTTYRLETFWEEAARIGFAPQVLHLVPFQPFNEGVDNAYAVLRRG